MQSRNNAITSKYSRNLAFLKLLVSEGHGQSTYLCACSLG